MGGNNFIVKGVERNDYICNTIMKLNTLFWENRVLPARELFKKYKETKNKKYLGDIQRLEPDPDDNPKYKEYLSDRHIEELDKIKGQIEVFNITKDILIYSEIGKRIKSLEQELRNKLTYEFVINKCNAIEFEDCGIVKYFLKNGNTNRELNLKGVKYSIDDTLINKIITDIKKTI
jgi:predicted phage-related endonuclease